MIISIRSIKALLKSSNKRTLLKIASGILILLLLIAAKVDWSAVRHYRSSAGGYTLRFPLFWSLHVEKVVVSGTNKYHSVRNVIELDAPGKPKPYILVSFVKTLDEQPVLDFVRNSSECDEITESDGEKIMVAGLEGRLFKDAKCNTPGESRVYVMNGNIGYNFIFKGISDMNVISQVLGNFQLTDSN